jgi:hypothetical protein
MSVSDLALSPTFATDRTFFVAGINGVHKSVDGGVSFVPANNGLPGLPAFALAISPDYLNDQTILVSVGGSGLFKSTNRGESWVPINNGLPTNSEVNDLAISPNFINDHTIFAGVGADAVEGVFRSTDGGANWTLVFSPFDNSWQSLALSPNYAIDGTVVIRGPSIVRQIDVFISQDRGSTWSMLDDSGLSTLALSGIGLVVLSPDFAADGRIFVGTPDGVWTTTLSTNRAPSANAGPDQVVNEGIQVLLDGSGSRDSDRDPLTFHWTQVAGPAVTLTLADPVYPTFTAPDVPRGGATLTFTLTVSDENSTSIPDSVDITVKDVNHPPVVDAGVNQYVAEGATVTLNGLNSFDPDHDSLTYTWTQLPGSTVLLSDHTFGQPFFTAPLVGATGETLTFELRVSDGLASATDTVDVFVENVNHPPTVNAGPNQTVDEGSLVTLDGTASRDPDSDPLIYTWTQVLGNPVALSDLHSVTPTFTAPQEPSHGQETLTFRLEVDDGLEGRAEASVNVTVLDVNAPPACGLAQASPVLLWPPDHRFVAVAVVGVSDPDNDQATLTVQEVTQDEPVNGLGDGDTSPDAVLQPGGTVLLRVERSGISNGRVYRVSFAAHDDHEVSCTGAVIICVPHDRHSDTCIDDGQRYDATEP